MYLSNINTADSNNEKQLLSVALNNSEGQIKHLESYYCTRKIKRQPQTQGTDLQCVQQPLAEDHEPFLLWMLSCHLVEDLHRVVPQGSQEAVCQSTDGMQRILLSFIHSFIHIDLNGTLSLD